MILFRIAVEIGIQQICLRAQGTALRVAAVTPSPDQPAERDQGVIFYDNFNQLPDWRLC
jgi:hypothetical protein